MGTLVDYKQRELKVGQKVKIVKKYTVSRWDVIRKYYCKD